MESQSRYHKYLNKKSVLLKKYEALVEKIKLLNKEYESEIDNKLINETNEKLENSIKEFFNIYDYYQSFCQKYIGNKKDNIEYLEIIGYKYVNTMKEYYLISMLVSIFKDFHIGVKAFKQTEFLDYLIERILNTTQSSLINYLNKQSIPYFKELLVNLYKVDKDHDNRFEKFFSYMCDRSKKTIGLINETNEDNIE